jgi:hypothetical protein
MFVIFSSHSSSCSGRLFGRANKSKACRGGMCKQPIADVDIDLCTCVSESAWMTFRTWSVELELRVALKSET